MMTMLDVVAVADSAQALITALRRTKFQKVDSVYSMGTYIRAALPK